jgi:hypothetical protein
MRIVPPAFMASLLLLALLPAVPVQAHAVTCDAALADCAVACLVHVPGGINHSCTVEGIEVFETYSCFPEGFHVEVLGVDLRRCGPPKLP